MRASTDKMKMGRWSRSRSRAAGVAAGLHGWKRVAARQGGQVAGDQDRSRPPRCDQPAKRLSRGAQALQDRVGNSRSSHREGHFGSRDDAAEM